jgi:hypothetical protein
MVIALGFSSSLLQSTNLLPKFIQNPYLVGVNNKFLLKNSEPHELLWGVLDIYYRKKIK